MRRNWIQAISSTGTAPSTSRNKGAAAAGNAQVVSTLPAALAGYGQSAPADGSQGPGRAGDHWPKTHAGEHRERLLKGCREREFTLRGAPAG